MLCLSNHFQVECRYSVCSVLDFVSSAAALKSPEHAPQFCAARAALTMTWTPIGQNATGHDLKATTPDEVDRPSSDPAERVTDLARWEGEGGAVRPPDPERVAKRPRNRRARSAREHGEPFALCPGSPVSSLAATPLQVHDEAQATLGGRCCCRSGHAMSATRFIDPLHGWRSPPASFQRAKTF